MNELLKQRVKGQVHFERLQGDSLWYKTDDDWSFPVPLKDTQNVQGDQPSFLRDDKGIYFMRWIRQALENT